MKEKCPNCQTDLRYVKSINQWLCNDCGFTVEGEPITVKEAPKIQSSQKNFNSLELYLLSFTSSIILIAFFSSSIRAAYPLQTFIALLILTALFYWLYWCLFTVEGRKFNEEYSQQQAQKNGIQPIPYGYSSTSSINSSLSKPFLSISSSNPSSSQSSNSKSFVTILNSGEIHISSQTIPEAKIAIKELKLKKKEYNLEKKAIIQKQKEIRAKYTDETRRRRSKARGRSVFAVISREIDTKSRDNARRDLANALQPLEQQKNSIETKINLIDQAVLHLEKFIAGLQ